MSAPVLSVIIPTFNNRQGLLRALGAITAQDLDPHRYEVVVVDDGSTDGTDEVVRGFRSPADVRYQHQPNRGRAAARNAGSRLARGRIVVYLDSDILAGPDLLSSHLRHYERHDGPIAVQGRTLTHPESRTTTFMRAQALLPDLTPRRKRDLSPYHMTTRNLSLRAEDLWATGGFDESFPGYGWEDIELGLRLRAHGVRVLYDADAVGYHIHAETLEDVRAKRREAGVGAVHFWTKYGRRTGLGLFLEIHPAVLPVKWLIFRTKLLSWAARRVLPWAERNERLWICSECYNHLVWEAYYDGVFSALGARARG